jgi:hypothetical protein
MLIFRLASVEHPADGCIDEAASPDPLWHLQEVVRDLRVGLPRPLLLPRGVRGEGPCQGSAPGFESSCPISAGEGGQPTAAGRLP